MTQTQTKKINPLLISGVLLGTLLISALPFYGYRVVANEFDQWVFLVFLAGWLLNIVMALAAFVCSLIFRERLGVYFGLLPVFGLVLVVTAYFGFGGVRRAFFEMVAG